ncbi:MAG: 50S ribosomal protein L3 [Acidiferrobacterales bacterium]|nr:50S ribosomal protein L3 [Acidiferrobacterales bacterium]
MSIGLIGKKIGMTRIFTEAGVSQPVTVIEVTPNRISQVRTEETDGYNALQVTVGERRANRVTKPMKGHFAKAGVEPGRGVWEFRLEEPVENEVGSDLTVEIFAEGQEVDVTGQTIGKGFAGAMKRHHFKGGRATHGNSKAHRLPGSIGQNQDPGKVFKGKKMAGHLGAKQRSQQNLHIVRVDSERNLLLVSGSVPGSKGSDVIVRPAVKAAVAAG